jgi:uncharacterized paraquat-inducible protein A
MSHAKNTRAGTASALLQPPHTQALHVMKYLCKTCEHIFHPNEAKCLNWRLPDQSFICPVCDTALKKPKTTPTLREFSKNLLLAILVALAAAVLANSIGWLLSFNKISGIAFIIIILSCGAYWLHKKPEKPIKVEPYE